MNWCWSGFGGSGFNGPFERMIGDLYIWKNGSYIRFVIRPPGEDDGIPVSLLQDELIAFLTNGEGHGASATIRIETDTTPERARRELGVESLGVEYK